MMRFYVLFAVCLALVLSLYGASVQSTTAAEVEYFTKTSADTINASYPIGFVSVEAVAGNVGVRVFGSRLSGGQDSLIVQSGDVLNLDLYKAGSRAVAFAVYPASGATARGIYW